MHIQFLSACKNQVILLIITCTGINVVAQCLYSEKNIIIKSLLL